MGFCGPEILPFLGILAQGETDPRTFKVPNKNLDGLANLRVWPFQRGSSPIFTILVTAVQVQPAQVDSATNRDLASCILCLSWRHAALPHRV